MENFNENELGYGRGWNKYYTEVPNEVFESKCTLTPTVLAIYLYLLSCLNKKKNGMNVWPSYETMARHTRMTRRSAINSVNTLVDKQYVYKKNRYINGEPTSNMYMINHPLASLDFLSTEENE